ncbi:MAG TPA: ABC transporter permease [Gammaproteobacteria bacterium]|nr:ABC transporter permease [Gammaproteobacteria bacterium]
METMTKDIRHAWRMFRENRLFTATALAALTLGIGVNIAIFSVVNAVLLKPVPFPDPDTLIQLMNADNGSPTGPAASPAKYMHWRAQTDVLEHVAAEREIELNYGQGELLQSVSGFQTSADYFGAYRPPLVMGRWFTAEEDLPNAGYTVVLSYNFWTQRLASDPNILGKSITLSGNPYTVVGVVGREFDVRDFGAVPEVWVPFQLDPNTKDQGHYFGAVGRLKPGVSLEQAQAKLLASSSAFRDRFGLAAMDETAGFTAITLQESLVREARPTLLVALGAVGFVLLIACANVANLLLIRATGRRRELAVRVALGAGRWRIMRQLLTESLMLSLAGGALGLLAGYAGMRALLTVSTADLPRLGDAGSLLGMDWRVVLFTVALSIATGIVFGLIPALVASRADLNAVIKDSSSRSGSGFRQNKTRSALVLVEVGLSVVLLVGAALLIRTSLALRTVNPGYTTENVLVMYTSLSGPLYQKAEAVAQTARLTLERVRQIPGVEAASMTCCVPLQGGYGLPFNIVGRTNEGRFTGGGSIHYAVPGYFDTFKIPVLRGRAFNESDTASGPPVVIISEALAKQYWKDGGDPLAEQMLIGGGADNMKELATEPVRQIIGIVGDVRNGSIARDPGSMMYMPLAQMPDPLNALMQGSGPMGWVIRTSVDPGTVSKQIQDSVRETTGAPVTAVQNMDDIVSVDTSRQRLNMLLMTIFGGSALVLAAIGIYGLMAYSVQHRTQEIGIRMALGAQADRVRWSIVGQGMTLVGVGIVVGIVAAFFLATFLAAVLYGVQARNPLVFVSVPTVLAATAFAAVWIAARRASRIDPLEALRYE